MYKWRLYSLLHFKKLVKLHILLLTILYMVFIVKKPVYMMLKIETCKNFIFAVQKTEFFEIFIYYKLQLIIVTQIN